MKLLTRHEFISTELFGWPDDEALLVERWAIRIATITPVTVDVALPAVKQFRMAGGDEEKFRKLEQYVCESGNSFIQLLLIVANLLSRGIIK